MQCVSASRNNYYFLLKNNNIPIPRITKGFIVDEKFGKVTRTQFPLQPNSAITINRSQGRTIPKGVVDLDPALNPGMHCVALSRFPNLSKIAIIALNEKNVKVKGIVQTEMKRLRTTKQFTLLCPPIDDIPKPKLHVPKRAISSKTI